MLGGRIPNTHRFWFITGLLIVVLAVAALMFFRTRQAPAPASVAFSEFLQDVQAGRVTHVTVIRTVQRLQRNGLVTSLPYRSIFLTEAGRKLASKARTRHRTVVAFLEALGISSQVARADAEGIEHHVSPETLAAFERFLAEKEKPADLAG